MKRLWREGCGEARSRGAAGIGDRDRGSGSLAGQPSSGVGQPTIGRPFYVQAKGQLRLTWRPSAGSPQSEGSRYTPIVNHLSINTSRRGGAFLYSRRGLRLWRRGAYGIHRACWPSVPRVVQKGCTPQGKRLTMICASLALLQIMFAVHRFAQGAADWRSGPRWSIISVLCPVHPFPLRGTSPRWEACHWIFRSLRSLTNPVPLPPQGETRDMREKTESHIFHVPFRSFPLWWRAQRASQQNCFHVI